MAVADVTSKRHPIAPVDGGQIIALTARVRKLREEYLAAVPRICAERSHLFTIHWRQSDGEPLAIRRAKAFQRVLEGITIRIRDGELIAGSQTRYVRGSSLYPEFSSEWIIQDLHNLEGLSQEAIPWTIAPEERETTLEDCAFWQGKSLWEKNLSMFQELYGNRMDDALAGGVWWQTLDRPHGRQSVDYAKVLQKGLRGLVQEIREQLRGLRLDTHHDYQRRVYWQAAIIACEAVIHFAERHAALALKLAAEERDAARKRELEQMAAICQWVPANPARTFREALQSFWFCHLALQIENCATGNSPGRMDQYLYPFYKDDLEEGRVTPSEAAELLGCLWVRFSAVDIFRAEGARKGSQASMYQNVTIGGVDAQGRDATNDLSALILEVVRQMRMPQPTVSLRYHDGLDGEFLLQAAEVNRDFGGGIPAWFNDKAAIPSLCQRGIPLDEARNWVPIGCVERGIQGATALTGNYGFVSVAKALELALYNGVDPRLKRQLGPATGDARSFDSFDEFDRAFREQLAYAFETVVLAQNAGYAMHADFTPVPFNSVLLNDCTAKGVDLTEGGGRWNNLMSLMPHGYQNTANSLAAIRKLVYEEKSVSMEELLDALAANFEGKDTLRQQLLAAPKYGNDDEYADSIMNDLFQLTVELARGYVNPWGEALAAAWMGITIHYYFGKFLGALPDGRKAGEPTADASLSAFRGTDKRGPTAVLNSAAKIDALDGLATLLNLKFHPSALRAREDLHKLLSLIKTYFDRYGYHLQFNILDRATLLEARKHPEKYRDLIVRVAGFSAYFVELTPEVQEEIIARTEHSF